MRKIWIILLLTILPTLAFSLPPIANAEYNFNEMRKIAAQGIDLKTGEVLPPKHTKVDIILRHFIVGFISVALLVVVFQFYKFCKGGAGMTKNNFIRLMAGFIILALLYVPFSIPLNKGNAVFYRDIGYHLLFSPPTPIARVNWSRVGIEVVIILVAGGAYYYTSSIKENN